MSVLTEPVAVRRTGVVLLIVGVICMVIEPLVTAMLTKLGVVVTGMQFGWWVGVSLTLGARVAIVGACLVAIGIAALVFAHFLAKPVVVDEESESIQC